MRIHKVEDYDKLSSKAANIIASQIILCPESVLGLATGSTTVGMYQKIVEYYEEGLIDFKEVVTFNLDEYVGLAPNHSQSYNYYMVEKLFNHINIPEDNIHIPQGTASNLEQVCLSYDEQIKASGGIDLQVLGIGTNGHIGFNEPDNKLNDSTHIVGLSKETIEANSRFFSSQEKVPRQAISMGMGNILRADKILLLASGERKAEAIRDTIQGKITTEVPASLLQLHDDVTFILDKEAASLL